MSVEMEREGDGFTWSTACKSSVLSHEQVDHLLETLDSLLCHITENPDSPAVSYAQDSVQFGNTEPVRVHRRPVEEPGTSEGQTATDARTTEDWSPMELRVMKVLAETAQLPEEEIERTQTIFHLGLDSISAIRVSSELRKDGIHLTVAEILRNATVEKISQAAEQKARDGAVPAVAIDTERVLQRSLDGLDTEGLLLRKGIEIESVERVMPATPGQVYMLSVWQNSEGTLFMPTFTFKSRPLDNERLRTAWKTLVHEESILRTTFVSTGNDKSPILQIILRDPVAQFESQEVSSNDIQDVTTLGVSQEQKKKVSLKSPPVRLTVINTPTSSVLLLTIQHALYDGVSLPLLLKKLRKIYNSVSPIPKPIAEIVSVATVLPAAGGVADTPLPAMSSSTTMPTKNTRTPSSPPTLADVVAYTCSRDRTRQEQFWAKYLDGANSTLLSTRCKPVKLSPMPIQRTALFNPTLFSNAPVLEEQCRKHGITLQSLFLATFSKLYAEILFPKHSSSYASGATSTATSPLSPLSDADDCTSTTDEDIIIGVYLSNRHLPINSNSEGVEDLAAPTLNLLPLRVRCPKSSGLQTLARRIQRDLGEISNVENSAGVSVADIERWTRRGEGRGLEGVRVDAWFNFLKFLEVEVGESTDQTNADADNGEDDDWGELEEIKPVIPATAAEALAKRSRNEEFIPTQPVGTDMLDTNVVRKYIMVSFHT